MTDMKFKRVFVPHYNFRFSPEPLKLIADEIVYVCDTPMFDDFIDDQFKHRFEDKVVEAMSDYDPASDLIAFYGDVLIFAMMIIKATEQHEEIFVARFSTKLNSYIVRKLSASELS